MPLDYNLTNKTNYVTAALHKKYHTKDGRLSLVNVRNVNVT